MFALSRRVFLFSFCLLPLSVYSISNEDFESFKLEMNHLRSRQDDLESRVDKLEELAKIGTLRTCAEYAQYGLKTSGLYMIDPDGPLLGQPPFQVYCDFSLGSTEVMHDIEDLEVVGHCHDPGCYEKNIIYSYPDSDGESRVPVPMTQIESLIQLSDICDQEFHYDCTLAPLTNEDVDFAFWEDRHGNKNNYFTGSNYGSHVCDCHYEAGGCIEEETMQNTCNCDANLPVALTDSGTITNSSALPVVKLYFGGLTYEIQYATYTLGRLKCYGEQTLDVGNSCSSLKQSGYFKSGYYNIKDNSKKVVFCDMTSDSYEDVPQSDEIVLSTIEDNKRDIEENKREIEENQESITELSLYGQWCAYQSGWTSDNTVVSYDSSFFEDSNINNNAMNIGTGVFTAPRAGVYLVTFSFYVYNAPGDETYAYLHHNGVRLEETLYKTYYGGGSGAVRSTGGRAVYQRLGAGDTLTLQTDYVTGTMNYIMFCIEFSS